ncbi:DUF6404 family protein [Cronobacter condimenti]
MGARTKIPPLPFVSFWQAILIMGCPFGFTGGALCGLPYGRGWAFNLPGDIKALSDGILFGIMMAALHRWRKKANNLPGKACKCRANESAWLKFHF